MKLLIKKNAGTIYMKNHYRGKSPEYVMSHEARSFGEMITAIEGMEIEVETEYLWDNQYNTAPIEGISENGLRILDFKGDESIIEEIIDDVRPTRKSCNKCGSYATEDGSADGCCRWCAYYD